MIEIKSSQDINLINIFSSNFLINIITILNLLQSLCENLILVDRLAYVEEVAFEMNIKVNSCIKRLPNDKLSPRCFIFIVEKLWWKMNKLYICIPTPIT